MKTNQETEFVIVWEFSVRKDQCEAFENAYASDGVWAKFFQRGRGYLQTELLRDETELLRYFTIDVWSSRAAYDEFREHNRADYDAINKRCEAVTKSEKKIGEFESVSAARSAVRSAKSTDNGVPLRIRPATLTDIDRMIALERAAESAAHWEKTAYRQIFAPDTARRVASVLIADGEDKVAGFVVGRVAAGECELENIVVDREQRRRGLGLMLVKSLIMAAGEHKARRIFLEVRESNQAARALYEKYGFKVAGQRKSYYSGPEEDAVLYEFEVNTHRDRRN